MKYKIYINDEVVDQGDQASVQSQVDLFNAFTGNSLAGLQEKIDNVDDFRATLEGKVIGYFMKEHASDIDEMKLIQSALKTNYLLGISMLIAYYKEFESDVRIEIDDSEITLG
jgi:hypothetical protein